MEEEFAEKRKHARLDLSMKVDYKISGAEAPKGTESRNVSMGGLLLLVKEKMDTGTPLELDVYLTKEETEPIKTKAQVVWQGELGEKEEGFYHTGISFSQIKDKDKRRFADFCFSQMYEMVGLPDWPTKR